MNGAYKHDSTPEGQFAAVVKALMVKFGDRFDETGQGPRKPDQADIREAIRPFCKEFELLIRIDEARMSHSHMMTERVKELSSQLTEVRKEIPKEFRS